jgi:hypothetical protein
MCDGASLQGPGGAGPYPARSNLFRRLAREINRGCRWSSDQAAPFCALGWTIARASNDLQSNLEQPGVARPGSPEGR